MARELDEFPEGLRVRRMSKYPWDGERGWLNGKVWELEKDTDFQVNMEGFKTAARAAAKTRGGTVKIARLDEKRIVMQFVKE